MIPQVSMLATKIDNLSWELWGPQDWGENMNSLQLSSGLHLGTLRHMCAYTHTHIYTHMLIKTNRNRNKILKEIINRVTYINILDF